MCRTPSRGPGQVRDVDIDPFWMTALPDLLRAPSWLCTQAHRTVAERKRRLEVAGIEHVEPDRSMLSLVASRCQAPRPHHSV